MRWMNWICVSLIVVAAGCATNSKRPSEEAKAEWNRARANVMAGLAKNQYEAGSFDNCRTTLDQAAALDPNNLPVEILSAKLGIEQGRLEQAESDLTKAGKLDPKSGEVDYLQGVINQRWQRLQAAYDCYTRASSKAPAELAYVMARGETLVAMDRSDEALLLLQEKVVYFEHSGVIRDAVGQLLMQRKEYVAAAAMLRQANVLSPDELSISEHLALAQYHAGQYRDAADTLTRVLKDDRCATRTDLLVALGECQLALAKTRDARNTFEKATRLEPGSAPAWLAYAKAALALDDTDRAEACLVRVSALAPQAADASVLRGYLRIKQGKLDEALAAFRKANVIDPGDTVSLCMIGYTLEKMGQSSQAQACYAQALRLKPDDELASRLMSQVDAK